MAAKSISAEVPDSGASLPRGVTIATAGHVDHGKSTLVRVLTGTDPDRLPEERRREMTIELGFASIARPYGGRLAFIDVPGHERLIETMIAGAATVDAALFVVAADDGPMPQTFEHLQILRLLGIQQIIVALTRIDLVDGDWLDLVVGTTRDLLVGHGFEHAPIVPVSAVTGAGLDSLRGRLLAIPPRPAALGCDDAAWLPIDRAFHRRGFGTIVAGTLTRGELHRGDTIRIWPTGLPSTVRQLQRHDHSVDTASAGQRVAVNLIGIGLDEVARGNVLSDRSVPATDSVDIWFEPVGPSPTTGDRVRAMVGTDRVDATIQLFERPNDAHGAGVLARLRFPRPIVTVPGDRLIVRRPSPAATIGGGIVLATHTGRPPRLDAARRQELTALAEGNAEPALRRRIAAGTMTIEQATADLPGDAKDILWRWLEDGTVRLIRDAAATQGTPSSSCVVVAESTWLTFIRTLETVLDSWHLETPEATGPSLTELRSRLDYSASDIDRLLALAVREELVIRSGGLVSLPGHHPRLRASERIVADRLLLRLGGSQPFRVVSLRGISPITTEFLEQRGALVQIGDDRVMSTGQFEAAALWVIQTSRAHALGLPTIRDQLGLGRDDVQRLLERCDQMGLTVRHPDGRRPGPAADEWVTKRGNQPAWPRGE